MPFTLEKMKLKDFRRIVDEAEKIGIFEIYLAGGEPLLHPSFIDILDYVLEKSFTIYVLTNGTLLTEDLALSIKNLMLKHKKTIHFQISIDSIDPQINDQIRGATDSAKNGIEVFLSLGITLAIGCVVTSKNIMSISSLIKQYYPRVKQFNLMPLMPTIQMALKLNSLVEDNYWQARERLAKSMVELKKEYSEISISIMEDQTFFPNHDELWNGKCAAGDLKLIIRGNLDVIPCNIAPNYILGNLNDHTLLEIWNSSSAIKLREDENQPACKQEIQKLAKRINEKST